MRRPRQARKKNWRQIAFTRFMFVVAFFALWIAGISARLVHLQITQHAWLKERAVDLRQDVKQARTLRGSIFDRNERTLAMSLPVKTLYVDPTEVDDVAAAARDIAKVLKVDSQALSVQLRQAKDDKKRFVPIARKLDPETVQKYNKAFDIASVKKADLPNFTGLHWRDDQKRSYPYKTLAAHVVGFANAADDGKAGIELSQDDVLHGAVIRKLQERDRLGRVYDETVFERDRPSDIVLTIDTTMQYLTEQALERGVASADARSGMAIVMRPKTGEILALANYPTFDPNTITESAAEHIGNKAIQSVYSPGSVFKLVTYGAALEKKMISPEGTISSGNGSITVAGHTFTDSHSVGTVSYAEAMAHSSNVCAIKTGLGVGRDDFFAMVQRMGFGAKTGIELPAEVSGIVRPPEKWNGDSLASMSIGYEIGVTALQMLTAFATIANDGIRIQPHIIKEIRHSDEQPKTVTEPTRTQVVSADAARGLKTMLRQVVISGTGRRAALNGYTAAGKTGTAWKFNASTRSVDSSKYISSFIGMAPAEDPEIVVAVVMDEPKSGARDGGMVSAPVFREVAQEIMQLLNVPTTTPVRPEPPAASKPSDKAVAQTPTKETGAKDAGKPVTKPVDKGKKDSRPASDKKLNVPGKLTALLPHRREPVRLGWNQKNELET
ncbi:MAG: penicillin-binding protein 2 [Chloracidobacterium sp.]|nr:penicillin-binding protein 2 [Chloracidobacterium sp.]